MINEEEYLKSKLGRRNPFTVPEDYFEQLTRRVMDGLPQQSQQTAEVEQLKAGQPQRKATIKRLRPWFYAAACLLVAVFVAALTFNGKSEQPAIQTPQMAAATQTEATYTYYSDNYIDQEADYAMIDNQEIYACLLADM